MASSAFTGYIEHLFGLARDQVLVNGCWRLNSDGSLDPGFSLGSGIMDAYGLDNWRMCIAATRRARLTAVGDFEDTFPVRYQFMVRLFPNGDRDSSFGPALNVGQFGHGGLKAQGADVRLWVGGEGSGFSPALAESALRACSARWAASNHSFNLGSGALGFGPSLAQRPDGQLPEADLRVLQR